MKKKLFTSFPVTAHTDYITQGSTFVVIQGQKEDGVRYIKDAVQKGATKIVLEKNIQLFDEIFLFLKNHTIEIEYVDDARKALAFLSAKAADNPAQKLKLFGVSGTKGKTSTTWMLTHLLKTFGKKVACLTTAEVFLESGNNCNELAEFDCSSGFSTPQPDYLHQFLKLCVQKNIEYVVLEIAVQAHTFSRLDGILLDGIIFTNIDQEHAELYPTLDNYFKEKQKVFEHAKADAPFLINKDDVLVKELLKDFPKAKSFSLCDAADYQGRLIKNKLTEQELTLTFKEQTQHIQTECTIFYKNFPGNYNALNMVSALGLLDQKGFDLALLDKKEISIAPIPGRLELCSLKNGAQVCIDYAHTGASFRAVLSTMRPWTDHLIVVFGAGGSKDTLKRPMMGRVASEIADCVIITDDNPRNEDPKIIVDQIMSGIKKEDFYKVSVEHDREKAIQKACALAGKTSIIMLLGKGPDTVQIVKNERLYFNEKDILKPWLL